jgi:small subunit ribosomal protein S2
VQTAFITEKSAIECGEYSHCRNFEMNTFSNAENFYGTVVRMPDLVIFLRTKDSVFSNHVAVAHSAKLLIPTIGIVDTTSDPRLITYPVPGNDDTADAIKLYCELFKQAILAGKQKRKQLIGDC